MKQKLEEIRASALQTIDAAADLAALEQLRSSSSDGKAC